MKVVLVGFMGSGKTSVGALVAERLQLLFVDSDRVVETHAGKTIAHIFRDEGEEAFRRREREVLQTIVAQDGVCVATGGGAFMDDDTRRLLLNESTVVFLDVPFDVLWQRIEGDPHRPLLAAPDAAGRMRALYASRRPIYEQAHIIVDASMPMEEVAQHVVERVEHRA